MLINKRTKIIEKNFNVKKKLVKLNEKRRESGEYKIEKRRKLIEDLKKKGSIMLNDNMEEN